MPEWQVIGTAGVHDASYPAPPMRQPGPDGDFLSGPCFPRRGLQETANGNFPEFGKYFRFVVPGQEGGGVRKEMKGGETPMMGVFGGGRIAGGVSRRRSPVASTGIFR